MLFEEVVTSPGPLSSWVVRPNAVDSRLGVRRLESDRDLRPSLGPMVGELQHGRRSTDPLGFNPLRRRRFEET